MPVTAEQMKQWCRRILGLCPEETHLGLEEYVRSIPQLDSLAELPAGTVVLVRGDVDCKPGPQVGQGDIRLRSMLETLQFGRQHGWKQVVFGHIGRKPEGTLEKVAARLGELLEEEVPLVRDWLDEDPLQIAPAARAEIAQAEPGSVLMLENTRRYQIERVLWKASEEDLDQLAPRLAALASAVAEQISPYYVNEAFAAGSLDTSTTVLPAAMQQVALGRYVAGQFSGPLLRCLEATLVVFSGLKIDKLDDLEAIVRRGRVRVVFSAGSLAMALKKAAARLRGGDFSLGVAEDPQHSDKPYYIPPERIDQATEILRQGEQHGVKFVLPVDFVLQDGSVSEQIGPGQQQLDVGPRTRALFEQEIGNYLQLLEEQPELPRVAFHNGVFGKFEDERFAEGTRHFVGQLKRLKENGVEVYVGGGEGGTALERYGQPDWVTHVFTAGGTVLNALGGEPVPYLVALRMAAQGAVRQWS